MQTFDIILAIFILVVGTVQGIRHGFIYQCVTLIAIFGSIWLSHLFAESMGAWISSISDATPAVARIASFAVIFTVVFILLYLLSQVLLGIIDVTIGRWADKLLGIIFGVLKTFVFVCLAVYLFDSLNNSEHFVDPAVLKDSYIYRYSSLMIDFLWPRLFS